MVSSSVIFGGLAAVVLVLVMGVELWRAMEQSRLLAALKEMQLQSIPASMEAQRLVRNLEAVRLEGEKVLAQPAVRQRMQSLYVVDVIVDSPGTHDDARVVGALKRARNLLVEIASQDGVSDAQRRAWADESTGLARLADQITGESIERLNNEVERSRRVVDNGTDKLVVSLLILAAALIGFVLLLYQVLIRRLHGISTVLTEIREGGPPGQRTPLKTSRVREICSIHHAIDQLEGLIQENESIRVGLEKFASTDALTGLSNRRHFMAEAVAALARARRSQGVVAVAIADLDHFKRVNDTHGHAAGDLVLKAVGELMRTTLRQTDIYCRYGGEEFAFLFPDTGVEEAGVMASRLIEAMAHLRIDIGQGTEIVVTLSIGVADVGALDLEAALNRADAALYRAKIAGRNRVEYAPETAPLAA